jgi:hypothetical protein
MTTEPRILKTGTCPSLSGKSTLTYHLGRDAKNALFLRIHANTGGGFFSREWVAWKAIQSVLEKHPQPFTSIALHPLFRGKSANTPAFLLAVLKTEGLLRQLKGKQRSHEVMDFKAFLDGVNRLIASEKAPAKKRPAGKSKPASSHTGR